MNSNNLSKAEIRLQKLVGDKYGRLTIVDYKKHHKENRYVLECTCECGNRKFVNKYDLVSKRIQSCGCLKRENTSKRRKTHGLSQSRLYAIHQNMKYRCNNESCSRYNDYGGRGIKVCDEWENSFEQFCKWAMSNGYKDKLTLDRINVDRGYSPDNCRWATYKIQAHNTRETPRSSTNIRNITEYNGKYYLRLCRDAVTRRVYLEDVDELIKIKEAWQKEYSNNPFLWVENTRNNFYKEEMKSLFDL